MQQTYANEPKYVTNAGRAGGTNAWRAGGTNAGGRAGGRNLERVKFSRLEEPGGSVGGLAVTEVCQGADKDDMFANNKWKVASRPEKCNMV